MSFAFLTCLLGSMVENERFNQDAGDHHHQNCFSNVSHRYFAQVLSARLACMSRLYNDYGSIARDRAEGNVNCVDFTDFHNPTLSRDNDGDVESVVAEAERKKEALLELAVFEREMAVCAGRKLVGKLERSGRARETLIARAVRLFMGTTMFYADLYTAKDLSNSRPSMQLL